MIALFFHFLILFNYFKCSDIDYPGIIEAFNEIKNIAKNYNECYSQIEDITNFENYYFKKNTKLLNSLGKGMDDVGDELECRKSNANEDYIFIKYSLKNYSSTNETDKSPISSLSQYLERKYSFIGICFPKKCDLLVKDIQNKNNFNGTVIENAREKVLNIVKPSDAKNNKVINAIFVLFFIFFIVKIIIGIISKYKYPKGYSYHGFDLYLKLPENIGNIDVDEEELNENDKLISEKLINKSGINKNDEKTLGGEYNPIYDFEPFYPMYFRLIKYLDIFNNFFTISRKRDRYFNEHNLGIISSLKAVILFGHIYSEAIKVFIQMPNTSVFNFKFYNSIGLSFYKIAINSLNFWVILEATTFSFKLMKFIKKYFSLNRKKITTKNEKNIFIFKLCLKFICFYIPKIITFTLIFIFFYYLFEYYSDNYDQKTKYYYIYEEHIKIRKCNNHNGNILYAFIPFVNYKYKKLTEFNVVCYPFTYVYSNMFFSSLLFLFFIIIIFYFENKIVDILLTVIAFLNLIINYIIFFFKDNKFKIKEKYNDNNDNKEYYTFFSHYSGENYSIFYPHVYFSLFYIGCLLGFCFFYYTEHIRNQRNKIKKRKGEDISFTFLKDNSESISNDELNGISSFSSSKSSNSNSSNYNSNSNSNQVQDNYEDSALYKPMIFCFYFITKLKYIKDNTKIILILVICFLGLFLSLITFILFKYYQRNEGNTLYDFKISSKFHPLKLLYFFEKIIHNFLFIIFACLVLVLPKKNCFSKIMRSDVFLIISRSGLFITCIYQSLIYILYCLFQIEIEIGNLMIFYITLGLYIMIVIFSAIGTIIIELPFRIIIKNYLKKDEKEESRIMLINMKNMEQMN